MNITKIKKNILKKYPFFGSIMEILDYVETKNCLNDKGAPAIGTNGTGIYYHPDFIEPLNESELTFAFAHEICHVAFDHLTRGQDKNQRLWNIATDAVINAFLKQDDLEQIAGTVDLPWAIKYNAEEVYDILLKEQKKNQKEENNGKTGPTKKNDVGHDTHQFWNEPNFNKTKKEQLKKISKVFEEMGEKEVLKKKTLEEEKTILEKIKSSLENSDDFNNNPDLSAAGNTTNEQKIKFDDIGASYPLINWPLILKRPTENVEYDWTYQNAYVEDGIILSSLEESSELIKYTTEIVLDTSGSIEDELLRAFLRECKNIWNFSKIKVGCFDTIFYGFKEIKNLQDINDFEFIGRGGTNFNAAIEAFSEDADNKIIFTDGIAPMPYKELDVLWLVFSSASIKPPGGKVVHVNVDKLIHLNKEYNLSLIKERRK